MSDQARDLRAAARGLEDMGGWGWLGSREEISLVIYTKSDIAGLKKGVGGASHYH